MKTYQEYGIEIPAGRKSGNVKVHCPRCHQQRSNKTDRSLSVDLDKGVWNCHYCGWGGKLEFTEEERKQWAKQQSWYNPHPIRKEKPVYKKPKPRQTNAMSDNAVKWLKFGVTYDYWCEKVYENNCMFGIVKTDKNR